MVRGSMIGVLLLLTSPASAAEVSLRGGIIYIVGPMDSRETFYQVEGAYEAVEPVDGVSLNSTGGDYDTGILIADFVVRKNLPVIVEGACNSMCAVVALTALGLGNLEVGRDASVGVHQILSYEGYVDMRATRFAAHFLKNYSCPEEPIDAMLATPPDDLTKFTARQLLAWGARELE